MKKFVDSVMNSFYCKLFFVLIPLLNEIPLLMPYVLPVMKLGLVWAAVIIVYDLFTTRTILKTRFAILLFLFVVCSGISVVMNMNSELSRMNIIEFFYLVVALLVLYPVSGQKSDVQSLREISIINYCMIVVTFAVALVSTIMFLFQYSREITVNDYTYVIGVSHSRMVGLYRNAIYPTAALGLLAAVAQLFIGRQNNRKPRKATTAFLIVTMVFNFIFIALQNSKGIFVGLVATLVVMGFLYLFFGNGKKLFSKLKPVLRSCVCVLIIFVSIMASLLLVTITRDVFSRAPVWVAEAMGDASKFSLPDGINKLDLDRDIPDEYGAMTGRPYIWKQGLTYALEKPLFGYGPYTLTKSIESFPGSTESISHFHNLFVHTLAACGFVGFAVFMVLIAYLICYILKRLFRQKNDLFAVFVGLIGIIVFLFVINLADTTILYQTKQSGFIFFVYLGYLVKLMDDGKVSKIDRPLHRLDALLDKIGHSKNKDIQINEK